MANYVKSGIDVSQWQGVINWSAVKPQIDFALLRAGYGDSLSYPHQIDTQFERNYSECKKLGIPVGIYYYSYAINTNMAVREAQSCIALLKNKQLEYPVFYDVEEMDIFKTGKTDEIIKAFCDTMEKAGYYCGIYIYRSAAQGYLNNTTKNTYTMAIAEYNTQCYYNGPYGIWQNSSTNRYNGISGNVDHDYCYVDYPSIIKEKGLNGFAKSTPTPTPKPTPAPTPKPTPAPAKKTVDELAKEVIAGKWGAGDDRKNRLTKAGYNYQAVQNRVNQLLNVTPAKPKLKSTDEIAREVIAGKWGAGEDRKKKLTAAGYNYQQVQNRVNQLLNINTKKSVDTIAREVIAGKWGAGQDRVNRLTKAGYNYQEVQNRVNQLLG